MGKIERIIYLLAAVLVILLAFRFIWGLLKIIIVLAGLGFVFFLIYSLLQDSSGESQEKAGNEDL